MSRANIVDFKGVRRITPALSRSRYVDVLLRREAAIAALYELFEVRLPARAKFWRSLARDQLAQAEVIRALSEKIDEGAVEFVPEGLNLTTAQGGLEFVRSLLARLRVGPLAHAQAVASALRVEHLVHHDGLLSAFRAVSPTMEFEIESFRTHLSHHARRMQREQRRTMSFFKRWKVGKLESRQVGTLESWESRQVGEVGVSECDSEVDKAAFLRSEAG